MGLVWDKHKEMAQKQVTGFYEDFVNNTVTCLVFYVKLNPSALDIKLLIKKKQFVKYLCTFLNNVKNSSFNEGFSRIKPRITRKLINKKRIAILNRYYSIMKK